MSRAHQAHNKQAGFTFTLVLVVLVVVCVVLSAVYVLHPKTNTKSVAKTDSASLDAQANAAQYPKTPDALAELVYNRYVTFKTADKPDLSKDVKLEQLQDYFTPELYQNLQAYYVKHEESGLSCDGYVSGRISLVSSVLQNNESVVTLRNSFRYPGPGGIEHIEIKLTISGKPLKITAVQCPENLPSQL